MGYSPEHYQANKEIYAARSKSWREKNLARSNAYRKQYYQENREKELSYATKLNRLRKTGVSDEQYQKQLEKQGGVCAMCSKQDVRALSADHDHATGKFRGLLCNKCNRGLGYLNDDILLLQRAIDYLKESHGV